MRREFPRLLVATEFPPNASGGGPAVVRQMLRGWPTEKLFWWSCRPDQDQRSRQEVASHFIAHIPERLYPQRRLTRLKAGLLRNGWTSWASARFKAAARECQPAVIWAIPHQWSIPPLAKILRAGGTPYHISIHDYPDTRNAEEKLGKKTTAQMLAQLERLYREANSRDVISNEMAADMQTRTGRAAENILHAGLEGADFSYLKLKAYAPRDAIKIAYAGTIVAEQSFLLLLESLARIRPRLTKPIELHFFGAHSYREAPWFRKEWMTEHGDLDGSELRTVLREFDWGLAPMEVTDENPRYNRYSLPTKIVSYLAAGLGMICSGHRESTVSCLARKYSLGVAFDDSNLEMIDDSLVNALSQTDVWSRYRSEITRCATNEFDADAMRARLFASLGVNGL